MLTFRAFVDLLRCPDCGGGLDFEPSPRPSALQGEYGVLTCACYTYPVVGDVPILRKERVTVRSIADARVVLSGPTPEELVRLIRAGNGLEGLLSLLALPVCPWPLNRLSAGRTLSQAEPLRSSGLALRRRALRRRLLAGHDGLTAEDWLAAFYWRSPTIFDPFSYFLYRFGQPRHLAALSLLSALPPSERPVLDLACGYGHLLHYLTAREAPLPAVGLDQNFHQAWVGRHWVAPAARFVCGDADRPLPFRDGAFSASICSDAFHYFSRQRECAGELRRTTAGGTVLLARVGNRLVEPLEGDESSPGEYAGLLAPWPHRLRGETELVDAYLRGEGPELAHDRAPETSACEKWLYFVSSENGAVFRRHGRFADWPHAAGHLALNPLYERRREPGAAGLALRLPSPWYASENARMTEYLLDLVAPGADALADVAAGRRSERVDALIEQFVVLGLPPHYARRTGRPWAVAANRSLSFLVHRVARTLRRPAREGSSAVAAPA